MDLLSEYPKQVTLKDGLTVQLRPMAPEDYDATRAFFHRLSEDDRRYLRFNVTDSRAFEDWMARSSEPDFILQLLALSGGEVVGNGTLIHNPFSWTSHVASIRLIVDPKYRRHGLGLLLACEISHIGMAQEIEKLIAEMATSQADARRIFEHLGFEEKAVFKGQIKDWAGHKHDMVIMGLDLTATWLELQEAHLKDFIGG